MTKQAIWNVHLKELWGHFTGQNFPTEASFEARAKVS